MRQLPQGDAVSSGYLKLACFLSPMLVRNVLDEMVAGRKSDATIAATDGTDIIDRTKRRAERIEIDANAAENIRHRLIDFTPTLRAHFGVALKGPQMPQFIRYPRGNFYRAHQDNAETSQYDPHVRSRRVTTVIFLNEQARLPRPGAYCGGDLLLYRCDNTDDPVLKVTGEPGSLIAFEAQTFHEVRPVTEGARFSIVTWYVAAEAE